MLGQLVIVGSCETGVRLQSRMCRRTREKKKRKRKKERKKEGEKKKGQRKGGLGHKRTLQEDCSTTVGKISFRPLCGSM